MDINNYIQGYERFIKMKTKQIITVLTLIIIWTWIIRTFLDGVVIEDSLTKTAYVSLIIVAALNVDIFLKGTLKDMKYIILGLPKINTNKKYVLKRR